MKQKRYFFKENKFSKSTILKKGYYHVAHHIRLTKLLLVCRLEGYLIIRWGVLRVTHRLTINLVEILTPS